jgi:hypothetical protein
MDATITHAGPISPSFSRRLFGLARSELKTLPFHRLNKANSRARPASTESEKIVFSQNPGEEIAASCVLDASKP